MDPSNNQFPLRRTAAENQQGNQPQPYAYQAHPLPHGAPQPPPYGAAQPPLYGQYDPYPPPQPPAHPAPYFQPIPYPEQVPGRQLFQSTTTQQHMVNGQYFTSTTHVWSDQTPSYPQPYGQYPPSLPNPPPNPYPQPYGQYPPALPNPPPNPYLGGYPPPAGQGYNVPPPHPAGLSLSAPHVPVSTDAGEYSDGLPSDDEAGFRRDDFENRSSRRPRRSSSSERAPTIMTLPDSYQGENFEDLDSHELSPRLAAEVPAAQTHVAQSSDRSSEASVGHLTSTLADLVFNTEADAETPVTNLPLLTEENMRKKYNQPATPGLGVPSTIDGFETGTEAQTSVPGPSLSRRQPKVNKRGAAMHERERQLDEEAAEETRAEQSETEEPARAEKPVKIQPPTPLAFPRGRQPHNSVATRHLGAPNYGVDRHLNDDEKKLWSNPGIERMVLRRSFRYNDSIRNADIEQCPTLYQEFTYRSKIGKYPDLVAYIDRAEAAVRSRLGPSAFDHQGA